MSPVVRGENWKLAYAVEAQYKTAELTAALTNTFGIFQTASMPDPALDIQPFWGHSTSSVRNWYIAYRGRVSLEGSIPDVLLLNGAPLHLPIGTCTTGAGPPYTHTIAEANTLKSITLQTTYTDTDGTDVLMRRYYGGKVGGATWSANEGGFLTMSLDRISFISLYHNIVAETNYYSANVTDITPSYVTTEPYLFSYGTLQLASTPFARVRSFRLSVDNSLEPKYYVYDDASIPARHPYEHREGRRRYSMSCVIDIEDSALYNHLLNYGTYSAAYKGFQAIMTFTRGSNDTITFTTPPSTPAAGGDAMGCLISRAPHNIVGDPLVSVGLEIIPRSLSISVVDSVSSYEGQE